MTGEQTQISQPDETAQPANQLPDATETVVSPVKRVAPKQELAAPSTIRTHIGKYKIKGLLGKGGMGEVYRAYQPALERDVAIKLIQTHLASDPDQIDQFRREARVVAVLRHPGIVQIHDFDVEGNAFYMVMEFIPGETLQHHLATIHDQGQQMPLDEALHLFRLIAEAVAYAHSREVIHRDLKPANVLLTTEGQPILVDFGLSIIMSSEQLTAQGMIMGTPQYMSPEQAQGLSGEIDARTDVYALGIILYEMTTGRRPFTGNTPVGIILKQISEPPAPPRSVNPNLPEAIEQIIQKALAKTPAARYPSAQELLVDVKALILPQVDEMMALPTPDDGRCPYRGLQTFEAEHAEFFFGREALINQLAEQVANLTTGEIPQAGRFLAILGASGSGKSSLVRAGLIPALQAGAAPGSAEWVMVTLRPGNHPLAELAAQLAPVLYSEDERLAATRQLLDNLAADGRALHLATRLAWLDAPPARRLLLIIDQFEEIFTLCQAETERQRFIENLLYAASIEGRLMILLTMRADFYHRCAAYRDLAGRISAHQVLVGPMNEVELQRAIERPAGVVGLRFESGLVDTIMADVTQQPGALPLLQHALLELWERRWHSLLTLQAYRDSGGVAGAIAQRAETLYASFNPDEQNITRQVMLRLTQPGEGTEDTRRRAQMSEFIAKTSQVSATSPTSKVIQQLTEARLLTITHDLAGGEEMVDVAHEALIRGWGRLRQWVDEDRAALRTHRRLTEAAREWEQRGRDESYLYQGTRLAEATEWAGTHQGDLNELEQTFISTSLARQERIARERQAQRRRIVGAGGVIAILIIAFLLFGLWSSQQNAQQQAAAAQTADALRQAEGIALATATYALGESDTRGTAVAEQAATAQAESTRAIKAENVAVSEAEARATQQAIAEEEAAIARSRELAVRADVALRDGDVLSAYQLALQAYNIWPTLESERMLFSVTAKPLPAMILRGHTDRVTSVSFNPDGRRIVSAGFDANVILWDADSGARLKTLECPNSYIINSAVFSLNGSRLVGAGGGVTCVWETASGKQVAFWHSDAGYVSAADINPAGTQIVIAYAMAEAAGSAQIFDVDTKAKLAVLTGHTDAVESAHFSPDGKRVVTASRDGTARIWDAASGTQLMVLTSQSGLNSAIFSPDGRYILTVGVELVARLWDAVTGAELRTFQGHTSSLTSAHFSRDGKLLVTTSFDGTARVWSLEDDQRPAVLQGHVRRVTSADFSPDNSRVVTAGDDGTIRVWNLNSINGPITLTGHREWVNSARFSPDGQRIVTASGGGVSGTTDHDNTVRVWDARSGRQLQVLEGHTQVVLAAEFSPDGSRIVSAGGERDWDCEESVCDFRVRVWDADSGAPLTVFEGHTAAVQDIRFSPDGSRLVTASEDGTAIIWDAETGEQLKVIQDDSILTFRSADFSPDGKHLVTTNLNLNLTNYAVHVWDVETGEELTTLKGHTAIANDANFSPDGRRIVTASDDSTAIIWDAESGVQLTTLEGHADVVNTANFSPDGRHIVTASTDGEARIWDAESGTQLYSFRGDLDASFSPDGTRIVTAGYDYNAYVWMVDIDEALHLAKDGLAQLGINVVEP